MNPLAPFRTIRTRRQSLALGLLAVVMLLWAPSSEAGSSELLVVVNSQNPAARLSAAQLRPIFQTSKRKWDNGVTIAPVNLPEKSLPRQVFDKAVMGFDPDTTLRYWIDRKVRGEARPPRKMATAAAVLAHVAATAGGIGYVPAEGSLGKGVKVVARVSGEQVRAP
jgi:hypothetical protein